MWLITGAGRGMGVDFAKAAPAAGNAVVTTGCHTAVGQAEDMLVVTLNVTGPADAEAAVQAALDRFGRIDRLKTLASARSAINNAANGSGQTNSWTYR